MKFKAHGARSQTFFHLNPRGFRRPYPTPAGRAQP
jgi:hypothetical protein